MNNEKTLEKLHGIAELLPTDERKNFDYYRGSPEILETAKKYADSLSIRLASMIADVEKEIKTESAKKSGKLNRFKAMQGIIKSGKTDTAHSALHGAWIQNDLQCVCDGFRIVRLSAHLDLEKLPDDVQPIDAERIILGNKYNNGKVINLPDVGTLRAYIKTEKATKKATKDKSGVIWDFGDELPAVNAQYLLDMLEIFPDATATVTATRATLSGIYFSSSDGDAILLPIRKEARR